jgi:hypothetical protein
MNLKRRTELLVKLGQHLLGEDEYLRAVMHRAEFHNAWFTRQSQELAIHSIATAFLQREALESLAARYPISDEPTGKTVGVVMAGNIPLVGFHDWLCVFLAGHRAQVKLSDKDAYLFPYLLKLMEKWEPEMQGWVETVERLKGFDMVIATGSNNSARYFEAYFGKVPHIIRRNRNGVAVLSGNETPEELRELGKDVFTYFGLGCRNVAKLYVPEGYQFEPLLEALHEYREIVLHEKYKHNFDYNYALFILNKVPHKANGCILLKEDDSLASRIACLHYAFYKSKEAVERELEERREEVQCVVAHPGYLSIPVLPFGDTQRPRLDDFADGVDTMEFLVKE